MGQAFGCIQVDQSTVAIRETFGKFDAVLDPGCHLMPWCVGKQMAGTLSLRVQQLDVRCETKTKVCCLCQFLLTVYLLFLLTFSLLKHLFIECWMSRMIVQLKNQIVTTFMIPLLNITLRHSTKLKYFEI
ncbi:hypothetical protein CsSME_00043692 [Camellia sinensis var. sinensis]